MPVRGRNTEEKSAARWRWSILLRAFQAVMEMHASILDSLQPVPVPAIVNHRQMLITPSDGVKLMRYEMKIDEREHPKNMTQRCGNAHGRFRECGTCGARWKATEMWQNPRKAETVLSWTPDRPRPRPGASCLKKSEMNTQQYIRELEAQVAEFTATRSSRPSRPSPRAPLPSPASSNTKAPAASPTRAPGSSCPKRSARARAGASVPPSPAPSATVWHELDGWTTDEDLMSDQAPGSVS